MKKFKDKKCGLGEMRRSISRVSLTMDFWTNPDELPKMETKIHCIDDSWSLRECVLGVDELMVTH